MGNEYKEISSSVRRWIEAQRMFFVATAPRADDGRINCSPKGLDSLRVLGPRQMVYADIGGSGIETVAHLKENGRIVIMMCALDGPPKIYRFYGRGRPIEPHQTEFEQLISVFPSLPTVRNLVVVDIESVRDACGYGVPLYEFQADRQSLQNWCDSKTKEEIAKYRLKNNSFSLDGLPGLDVDQS